MARKTRKTARAAALDRGRASGRSRGQALLQELASTDAERRCMAALELGRYGDPEHAEPLRERVLGDDLELAACCRVALAVHQQRLDATRPEPPGMDEIRRDIASPFPPERSRAARALARMPALAAVPVLGGALASESDGGVLGALLLALGAVDAANQIPCLTSYLRHHDDRVRACALEALWGLMATEVGHAALPLVKDASPKVRAAGLILLIRRAHETSRAMANTVLASQRTWMRLTALFALGGMNDAWARQMVIQHVRNTALPPLVRAMARESVALAGTAPVARGAGASETVFTDLTRHLPALPDTAAFIAALENQDPLQRVHGLQNAWRFPADDALPRLVRQAELETDPLVLATLVKALGRVGGASQLEAIREFLEHEDERVRANAVEALALAQEGPELREMLKNLLAEDEGARPRKQAAAQLFASDAADAVAHFRGLLLSADAAARGGAISMVNAVQDDRLIPVLAEALRDPRRDVQWPIVNLLIRTSLEWPAAGELLTKYRKGEVAGEVIGDEPVTLLMADINSPKPAERIRAMSRLVESRDLRVNTVLELNLGSRDPEVAHEAARVLRERHRAFTLPALYEKLGELYRARAKTGDLVVSQEIVARLPAVALEDEAPDAERLRWLGKALYDAFDDELEMDSELRAVCLDVRAALEQLGNIMSPVTRPERLAASSAILRREALRAAGVAPDEEVQDVAGPRRSLPLGRIAALAIACVALVLFLTSSGGEEVAEAGSTSSAVSDPTTRLLDAMGLESDTERFRERFRGRALSIDAKLVSAGDSQSADLRAGTVLFRLRCTRGAAVPAGLRPGQRCAVRGSVAELAGDGAIVVEGSLTPGRDS